MNKIKTFIYVYFRCVIGVPRVVGAGGGGDGGAGDGITHSITVCMQNTWPVY